MKQYLALGIVLVVIGCGSKKEGGAGSASGSGSAAKPAASGTYFEFSVDDKPPIAIAATDVSSSFRQVGDHTELKIFGGPDGAPHVVLIATSAMTGPGSTPNGAPAVESGINQGSVSLQDFPEKGYTTNSFNATYPELAVVVPDAVVITAITADGKDAKLVTGTFSAKTYGSHSKDNKDAKDTDHVVKGQFRIRHEFTSTSGDRF